MNYLILTILLWGVWGDWQYRKSIAERKLERRNFASQRDRIVLRHRPAAKPSRVSGIQGGMWVCEKTEYEQQRKAHRRENSGDRSMPFATYRLVVATIGTEARTQRIAFTDGTFSDWYPTSFIYTTPPEGSPAVADGSIDQSAAALEFVMQQFSSDSDTVSVGELMRLFGPRRRETLIRSLEIGLFWGLIEASDGADPSQLIQTQRDTSAQSAASLRVTQAGRVWRLCSPESIAARKKEKQMSDRRGPQFRFYKGSQNNVNYAEGDIVNPTANFDARPADDRVLEVLSQLLKRSDLPWEDPQLANVRPDIERAVTQRNTKDPALLTAVRKLMDFGGAIALGVGGNAAYEVLKAFAQ